MAYGLSNMRIFSNRTYSNLAAKVSLGKSMAPILDFPIFPSQNNLPGVNQAFEETVLKVVRRIAAYSSHRRHLTSLNPKLKQKKQTPNNSMILIL
jgi:hypothetical protein